MVKTEQAFLEAYDGAPFSEDELANCATGVADTDLGKIARAFLKAREKFTSYLDEIGFEWG